MEQQLNNLTNSDLESTLQFLNSTQDDFNSKIMKLQELRDALLKKGRLTDDENTVG